MENLDQAIKHFDDWDGAALIYYDKDEKYFDTEVYGSDVQAVQTDLAKGMYGVFRKGETEEITIDDTRKKYIEEYANLLNEGYDSTSADYQLIEKYPFIK